MNDKMTKTNFKKVLGKLSTLLALVVLCVVLTIVSPQFLTLDNWLNITRQAAINAMISLGLMVCILTGGIDLSVGSIMALSAIIMAKCVQAGWNGFLAIFVCLAAGAVLGMINGLLLTVVKLPHPFIATLGTQNIYRGLALIITAAIPISLSGKGIDPATAEIVTWIGGGELLWLPVCLWLIVVVYFFFNIFLKRTTLGRHIYAIGGNRVTARLSGVNVERTLTLTHTISGLMSAAAALVLVGRTNSASPIAGINYETDAIAAVIIGGGSFFGGRGTTFGTLTGVVLIAVLRNGLNLLDVTADAQLVVIGLVIILAVAIDILRTGGYRRIKKVDIPEKPSTAVSK